MYLNIPKKRLLLLTVLLSLIQFKYPVCIGLSNPGGSNPWNVYYLWRRVMYTGFSEKIRKRPPGILRRNWDDNFYINI